jgi:hypothetical protein
MTNDLFKEVVRLSGLPQELISKELKDILNDMNVTPAQVTEEQMRAALAKYLKNIANACSE